jgi:putative membrane protein
MLRPTRPRKAPHSWRTGPRPEVRLLVWVLRALIFFVLFAFALNNQHQATVHWFFGAQWSAPMVILVLAAFAMGCAVGVLVMVPGWWRHRREVRRLRPATESAPNELATAQTPVTLASRDGL